MSLFTFERPDPARTRFVRSIFHIPRLGDVAEAIAEGSKSSRLIYVERMARGWRWSLAHEGSGYPLLRETARFLQMDHHQVMVGFRTVGGRFAIIGQRATKPRAWTVLRFEAPAEAAEVLERIRNDRRLSAAAAPAGSAPGRSRGRPVLPRTMEP